jgi:transposase
MMDVVQESPPVVILAEDEASLYLQATRQSVWAPQGQTPSVRVDAGRTKTNFYGTLNLSTGHEVVLRTDKMNAATSALYLEQILQMYPDSRILMLWDRAPWHHGAAIRHVLEANPRLELLIFPVAAPELNPQEHVWKATRRAVSHNHTEPKLPGLAERFEHHLKTTCFESSFLDRYGYNTVRPMFN